jgi:hypothetical protein
MVYEGRTSQSIKSEWVRSFRDISSAPGEEGCRQEGGEVEVVIGRA